ncbi:MAG: hypothetical protein HYR67_02510 [Bacteroidetes bacterium]|nr:hypothetical protein [Bacteroidota bacterium]
MKTLEDRIHAARLLCENLAAYKNSNAVIVAVAHGGVPVGFHIADILHLPLEVIPCKKIVHPFLAHKTIGSVCLNGTALERDYTIPQYYVNSQISMAKHSLQNQYKFYTNNRMPIRLKGRIVILVDDQLSTGDTILACLKSIQKEEPEKIIIAAPVTTLKARNRVIQEVEHLTYLLVIDHTDTAQEYFTRVKDEEVKYLLSRAVEGYNQAA